MQTNEIVILCTVPNEVVAENIARMLVENKIAACVNIVPNLVSIYSWKGQVCRDSELLCIIKSKAELFEKIETAIKSVHPYEIPEIIALPIIKGHAPYISWIYDVTI
ncbi:MAG: divalent-cation tolerance protein CutA [Spirochaetes bacterium]|nr:divalent-cation tolerance protein CutA [Spirochaetota bacterium]